MFYKHNGTKGREREEGEQGRTRDRLILKTWAMEKFDTFQEAKLPHIRFGGVLLVILGCYFYQETNERIKKQGR